MIFDQSHWKVPVGSRIMFFPHKSALLVYLERCLEGQKFHREEVSIEGAEVFFSKQTERLQVNSNTLHIKTIFQN